MRKVIFRKLLGAMEERIPDFVRRVALQILTNTTAQGFGQKSRILLFSGNPLQEYALFTQTCLEKVAERGENSWEPLQGNAMCTQAGSDKGAERGEKSRESLRGNVMCTQAGSDEGADRRRMLRVSWILGRRIRRISGFTEEEDILKLLFFLYRIIGIQMSLDSPDTIVVDRCFFSNYYSPANCHTISAMDYGLVAGLTGGKKMRFTERITEGCANCRACLTERRQIMEKKKSRKTALIIGTGAGGATIAKELQGKYQVTVLEAGKEFKPFSWPVQFLAKFRKTGLFFDERLIRLLLPNMIVEKTKDMVLVRGKGLGGTTTLATGNAVRYDGPLKELGINLDAEFAELYRELPITTDHQKRWTKTTRHMYQIFEEMGLAPVVTPKFLCAEKCVGCGHCAIGCPTDAKWDTRQLVEEAVANGATLVTGAKVTRLEIKSGKVTSVHARKGLQSAIYQADLVILAAGGLGTPVILKNSGIPCTDRLFVDPVLCVAGPLPDIHQERQILMPFISQQEGYILSPYMDYLSFFFNKHWFQPMQNIASIMIKLADEEKGNINSRKIDKTMTATDHANMEKAVEQSRQILEKLGVPREKQFLGTLNAGHPGGMLPLTAAEKETLHNPALPANLYIADATILPKSMGNPPILTIMALAKRIASLV